MRKRAGASPSASASVQLPHSESQGSTSRVAAEMLPDTVPRSHMTGDTNSL